MTEPISDERLAEIRHWVGEHRVFTSDAEELLAEVDRLRGALARVEAIHERAEVYDGELGFCKKCVDLEGAWWPCATIRAVIGGEN
ncbi:hypothetical protein [Agrococcus sp. DT81.2]|uniref:hypothetical protein n=1 Tax=Agrococcus sp. DT81.2 TaxID=3393414 RepID=UPI003CE5650A